MVSREGLWLSARVWVPGRVCRYQGGPTVAREGLWFPGGSAVGIASEGLDCLRGSGCQGGSVVLGKVYGCRGGSVVA